MIPHLILRGRLLLFSCQMYLESSVSFWYLMLLMDFVWFRNLILNSLAVTPMYVFVSLLSAVITHLYYNPPFSKNVKTNIARGFLKLIDKHFPHNNKLHKIFKRHTVRVSYSCSEDMKCFINRHNKTILKKHDKQNTTKRTNDSRLCNCRNHNQCPMQGNCLQANVVYKAEITTADNNETKTYIGVTANEFKIRFRNHTKSINNIKYQNETELSKYIWQLKRSNRPHKIKWGIIKKIPACKPGQRRCGLYFEEKLLILKGRNKNILNKRSELFSKCRHVTKHYL